MFACYDLRIEYQKNPIGIDEEKPRFSWKIKSDSKNVMQKAYRIVVDDVWDSGKVGSSESLHLEYNGEILKSKKRYSVKVKIWDESGEESEWCEGFFETGILDKKLWKGLWLCPETEKSLVPEISKDFEITGMVKKARVYATAYGIYDLYINGKKVSDRFFAPGCTSYKKRLQYQTYEVKEYLNEGKNTITLYLARGWATGRYPFGAENPYKMEPSVMAQLEYEDEFSEHVVPTDMTWNCRESKLKFSEIYDGEIYDNSFEEEKSIPFKTEDLGYDNLIAQINEPVRVIDKVVPIEIIKTPKGETVIDFGQNLVGWVEFKANGKKGDKVILKHAEVLDKFGNFYTANLRSATQTVEYILKGDGEEIYHSRMSFQGFRYIKIESFPEAVTLDKFTAQVICSDMERTGRFESSSDMLNKLYNNVWWGQIGNFVDIPTDCPQRDERAGWTADAQVFCKTAAQNMNTALFFKKWLGDLKADQGENGEVYTVVPSMWVKDVHAAWGDAVTICPWEIYWSYGDKKILEEQYDSMKKWIEYVKNQGDNPYLWNTGVQLGDWLGMDGSEGNYSGMTSKDYIASAYYAYSTALTLKTAEILGIKKDIDYYKDLYGKIIENINDEYISKNGRVCDNTQTAQAVALKFGLVKNRERVAEKLNDLVVENQNRISTGFIGTTYICDMLCENGYSEKAFELLFQEEYPSWFYSIKKGATTIWEHWDGIKPNGDFWSKDMNSYNHYAYGSIADFMYKKIGGISPLEPGYKEISIKPVMDKHLTYAKTSVETMYGKVSTDWEIENEKFVMNVEIPCNTKAHIELPNGECFTVGSGKYSYNVKL